MSILCKAERRDDAAFIQANDKCRAPRLLLVDSNDLVQKTLVARLAKFGYAMTAVSCAEEALLALERETFDYLLADVILPGQTTGAMLGREVRERWPDTRVLLMTGYAVDMVPGDADLQEFSVLLKPFGCEDLRRALDVAA